MISGLIGRLDTKLADAVLIDVGGVIYRVGTSTTTINDIGDAGEIVRLSTHLFVREDQLTLYGFATQDELRLFETLISVTGVGPRMACAILSHFAPDRLHEAIAQENDAEVVEALRALGYTTAEAHSATARTKSTSGATVEERVVAALRDLAEV
jgi:Holliday junction DNA helicase RuvA